MLERRGVVLALEPGESLVLDEAPSGTLSFELRGSLPDGRTPPLSTIEVRERWRRLAPNIAERWEYEFELLDHERDVRRAFHLHDSDYFVRNFEVVVHEHCERPMGRAQCPHHAGSPVLDGYRGVDLLLGMWMDPIVPDCEAVECLE